MLVPSVFSCVLTVTRCNTIRYTKNQLALSRPLSQPIAAMNTHTDSTATAALAMLGEEADNVTQAADAAGVSPAAMLAAAWQVLERQNNAAQPWTDVASRWCDEESATRQDVILAAVRIEADQRRKRIAA